MPARAGERRGPACTGQNPTFSSRQALIENQMPLLLEKPNCQRSKANQRSAAAALDRVFRLYLARGAKSARILDSTDSPRAVKGGFSTCENRLVPCARGTRFTRKERVKTGRRSQF